MLNISSGFTLTGASISLPAITTTEDADEINVVDGKQILTVEVRGFDYLPDKFTVKKGIPIELHVNGKQAQGCAQILTIPSLGITERLSKQELTVIPFVPEKVGTIKFTCSMGMAGPGTIEVVP